MSVRVQLPSGCYGLEDRSGKTRPVRPGSTVSVSDETAARIRTSKLGSVGLLSGTEQHFISTKNGRWCTACRRLWNSWNSACPKCGDLTVPEGEMEQTPPPDGLSAFH